MKKIVVDTNFLVMQYEYRVDLPSELQRIVHEPITLVIPSGAMDELRTLAGRAGRKAAGARFVLQNMEQLRTKAAIEIIASKGEVDGWIFKFAKENPVCVATNDVPLRKRLLASGVPVIAMKGKSKLDFV
jgi:rRNA-processing protein FCF1